MLGTTSKKAARDLFNDICMKIQLSNEVEANIIPFEFLGVIKDYNGVYWNPYTWNLMYE